MTYDINFTTGTPVVVNALSMYEAGLFAMEHLPVYKNITVHLATVTPIKK